MTENEALKIAINCLGVQAEQEVCEECPVYRESGIVCKEIARTAITALKEIQQYREIGTVEELKNSTREEDILKFYYCESEDDYYIGKRVGNFYYARYGKTGFTWFMSRYLPWGEHVIAPNTLWKEHIYPSEPKEIPFFEWLQGFIKKYCGGTVEECREAVEKQKPKVGIVTAGKSYPIMCPSCGHKMDLAYHYCVFCGQSLIYLQKHE